MPISDSFDLGHDIQTYYSLYQGLTLEDLAKANRSHTVKGIMKVVSKVTSWLYIVCQGDSSALISG